MSQFRATIQFNDATPEYPTFNGPWWDIRVYRDGTCVLDTWSLGRWLSEPWADHNSGVTPHRGWMRPWAYLPRETQDRFIEVAGYDFDEADHENRIRHGLDILFPGIKIRTLPVIPAGPQEDNCDDFEHLPMWQATHHRAS